MVLALLISLPLRSHIDWTHQFEDRPVLVPLPISSCFHWSRSFSSKSIIHLRWKAKAHTTQWKYSYLQLSEEKLQRSTFRSPGCFAVVNSCCLSVLKLILLSRLEFQSTQNTSLWMGPGHLNLVTPSKVILMSSIWGSATRKGSGEVKREATVFS